MPVLLLRQLPETEKRKHGHNHDDKSDQVNDAVHGSTPECNVRVGDALPIELTQRDTRTAVPFRLRMVGPRTERNGAPRRCTATLGKRGYFMSDEPIERTGTEARQAVRAGRVIIVLGVSMTLALVAMFALLAYVYSTDAPFRY